MTNQPTSAARKDDRIAIFQSIPFVAMHLSLLLPLVTGVKWQWVVLAIVSYYVRMFGVTAGYHRYFSHRAFQTNRVFQFFLAFLAQTSIQKGALWWAANHRHHHRYSDAEEDIHSPVRRGFWWSHVGWVLSKNYEETKYGSIKDFSRYPELVWLNEHHLVPPVVMMVAAYLIGGLPGLVWGALIPTVFLWHGTFTINSLSHIFGKRRYLTTDTSRNNWLLALITCGEGWHNNHHYHQNTANQGWFWWEIDVTYYVLKALSVFGIVTKLRTPSEETRLSYVKYTDEQRAQLERETRFNGLRQPLPVAAPKPSPPGVPALVAALKQTAPAPAK